ncbi:uncharacterized protein [Nothobranchius furzeri]|uniref:LOC107376812-like protein n=2 Tax=Nothobranchius furzeri TaxID=105023 RepID=A0A9D3C5F9_NOTFU|nr:uncharacterized protein LOC107376812 isoform X2 [Nothobranchius furzeri]KAF7229718.1 putative LOC107376812-like protein [Nothobranchius furzeri]
MKTFVVSLILLPVFQDALGVEVFDDVESVQLPCQVTVSTSSDSTVVWSREDLKFSTVHVRQQNGDDLGEQNQRYSRRTSMRADALQTGDLSLVLMKPEVSDSENYTCTIRRFGKELEQIHVLLRVLERPPLWPKVVSPVLALLFVLAVVSVVIIYCRYKTIKYNPVYKLQLQKAVAGQESVSLPCKTKTRLPLDATVEWRRIDTDTVVYTYPNNVQHDHAQHESYQECTEMIENPLRTGDLTLTLLGPCPSDSGLYVCTVLKEGRKLKQKIVSLTVEEHSVPDGPVLDDRIWDWFRSGGSSRRNSLRQSLKSSVKQIFPGPETYEDFYAPESNSGGATSVKSDFV